MGSTDRPQAGVKFLSLPALDLGAMREFYTDRIGLHEIYHSDADRTLAYDCDGLQFTILESPDAEPAGDGWATQPGWRGETQPAVSWSVVLDEPAYRRAVATLRAADVPRLHDEPVWVEYWSFVVRDPMGNTVELSLPIDEPADTEWPAFMAAMAGDGTVG